jgi:ATP-dependent Clp protease adaptor protein ClpS
MVKERSMPSGTHKEQLTEIRELVLYNDDHNTFDFVIDTLVEVCNQDPLQAEQCTLIVHYKGKCSVKSGDFYELKPAFDEMCRRDLTVSIE